MGWGWGLFLLLLAGCHPAAKDAETSAKPPLPVVTVATAQLGAVAQTLPVTGTLSPLPNHEAKVSAPFAGTLSGIFVRPDQEVEKGQQIGQMSIEPLMGQVQQAEATIKSAELQVQQARINAAQQQTTSHTVVAQANAQLASAQATLDNAQINLAREKNLFSDGLVAKKDVDDAQLAVDTAKATVDAQKQAVAAAKAGILTDTVRKEDIAVADQQVKNAQGALATAHAQINLAAIRAPVTGTVATVSANDGETVDTSTTLLTIVDMRSLVLTVSLPSASLGVVHPGQFVEFTTDSLPGRDFRGIVGSVGAQVDPATGTVPVTVSIPNGSRLLKDDMMVTGDIVVARHAGVLLVPKTAILTDPQSNETSVVVVDKNGVAHVRNVTTGLTSGDKIQIKKGATEGEQVAVSGQYSLPDGTQVSVQAAGATKDAP